MIVLVVGLALFICVHLVKPTAPGLRVRIVAALGETAWRLVVAVLLVLSIWLMAKGYGAADPVILWTSPTWVRHLTVAGMLPALMMFFSTYPGSWLRAKIRHPQLTGFKLWAMLHLFANGDLPSLILFGGLLAWAVVAVIFINRRGKPPLPEPSPNPVVAFAFLGIGLVAWVLIFWAHGAVFGVPPLA